MTGYNYKSFSSGQYDLVNFTGPDLGEKAPNPIVTDLAGNSRPLLDFTGEFLVLELGSITCPLFQSRRAGMAALVREFPNISFEVLYVREAHPGASVPAHASRDDKVSRARQLRDTDHEGRAILIDDLDGTAHTSFGSYPNAVFIINQSGCVVYRSAWNNPGAIRRALRRLLAGKPVRAEGMFLPAKPPVAIRTLRAAGKGAAWDFLRSLPSLIWKNLIRRNLILLFSPGRKVPPDVTC